MEMGRAELQGKEREQYNWKSKKLDYTLVGKQIKKYRILIKKFCIFVL